MYPEFVDDGYPSMREHANVCTFTMQSPQPSAQPQPVKLPGFATMMLPAGFWLLDGHEMPEEPPGIWMAIEAEPRGIFLYFDAWTVESATWRVESMADELRHRHDATVAEAKRSLGWQRYLSEHSLESRSGLEARDARTWIEWNATTPTQVAGESAWSISGWNREVETIPWFDEERAVAVLRGGAVGIIRGRARGMARSSRSPEQIEASNSPEFRETIKSQLRLDRPELTDEEWEEKFAGTEAFSNNYTPPPPATKEITAAAIDDLMRKVIGSWQWV